MPSLLDDPAVQAGLAPLLAALAVGGALWRTRLAWLGVAAAVACAAALTTGLAFSPLTASRKAMLLVLAAPLLGIALDARTAPAAARTQWALAALAGLLTVWVFFSVLSQRETAEALALGGGVALFVAAMVALTTRLRDDGVAGGAATVGLGLAVGLCAFLSASAGNLVNGVALAAGGGALMLLQFALGRANAPGWTGTLSAGLGAALFASAVFVLAELRWFVLALLLLVPVAASLPLGAGRGPRQRLVLAQLAALAAGALPVAAAWFAARAGGS